MNTTNMMAVPPKDYAISDSTGKSQPGSHCSIVYYSQIQPSFMPLVLKVQHTNVYFLINNENICIL